MNKIEELIQELCPEGLEYKNIGSICNIKTGKGITKKDSSVNGLYPIISGGKEPMGFYNEYNRLGKTVTISRVGANAGYVKFINSKFYLNDKCFSIIPKDKFKDDINTKYLYYKLKNIESEINELQSEGGVPTINTNKVSSLNIPIPPLPIQQEIVNILDKFTQLEEDLQAELESRRTQYEFYLNQLMEFEGGEVEWKILGEIVNIQKGVRVVRNQLLENGKYPVYQNSMKPLGYFEKYNYKANTTFIISAGAAGDVGYSDVDFWAADDCFLCICPDYLKSKFLYYVLLFNQTYLNSRVRRASVPRLSRDAIAKIFIPIPPLSEQERIVSILDKFDALVNDTTIGLQAEIDARRKQYEYYRNKLLTFAEYE